MIVEAASLRDADLTGEFPVEGVISSTPVILGEHLFVATVSSVSRLHCFSLVDGTLGWQRTIDAVQSALCAHDGAVFAASRDGQVYRFAASDSTEQWNVDLDARVRAAPAAADSVLVIATAAGDVYGLSARNGMQLWRVPTFASIAASPVIVGGRVIAVNREGRVVAIDLHEGTLLWEQQLDAPVYYGPAAQSRRLVFPLASGALVLIDPEQGATLGRVECGELPGASPQLAGDVAYQLLRKGLLLRVDLADGTHTTVAELPQRSETPPLLTPQGIVLVDEDGEAVLVGGGSATDSGNSDRIER
jgi:outer membrane protein assembly factor BamB